MRLLSWPPALWKRLRRQPLLLAAVVGTALLAGLGIYFLERDAHARWHWRQAELAIEERDFAPALVHLQAFVEMQPSSGKAHFLLARTYRRARKEDFDQAEHHLATAKRLRWPEEAITKEFYLLDFQKHGRPEHSEGAVRQLLDDPTVDRRLVLEALVRGCLRADRLTEAVTWLDRWVKSYPDDWYAYLCRGTLSQHLERPARAVADYERVLRWKPDSADVKQRLGLALVQGGSDYQQALRYLEDHRQSHPDDPDTLVGIARCRSVLNQPEAARALLQAVLATHPENADALLALALVELDLDNPSQALYWLRRLEPLSESARSDEMFHKLLRLEPVGSNTTTPTRLQTSYQLLATVLRRLGQEKEAQAYEHKLQQLAADVDELRTAIEANTKDPRDVAVWPKLATCYLRVGMKDNAALWFLRVLQNNPHDRRAHRMLADYYRGRPGPESQRKAEQHRRLAGSDE